MSAQNRTGPGVPQSSMNCWLRGRLHGPFAEYDPPYPGTRYVFPHYRCKRCGRKMPWFLGAFLRPVR